MSDTYERMIDRAAQALYESVVRQAADALNRIEFECDDLTKLLERLVNETETAQVLIFAGFLEDKFTTLFKLRLRHLTSQSVEDEIFGSNGPLGSFGNRINLAYQLGWLTAKQKSRLDSFRKIRNAYAHDAYKVSFKDQRIAALLRNMDLEPLGFVERLRSMFAKEDGIDNFLPIEEINEKLYLCLNFGLLASKTFEEMLLLPTALEFRVDPGSLMNGWEKLPKPIQKVHLNFSRALLTLLLRSEFKKELAAELAATEKQEG